MTTTTTTTTTMSAVGPSRPSPPRRSLLPLAGLFLLLHNHRHHRCVRAFAPITKERHAAFASSASSSSRRRRRQGGFGISRIAGTGGAADPPSVDTRLYAKKKKKGGGGGSGGGGKGKGGGKKQPNAKSGFEWASSFSLKPYEAQATRDLVSSAVASFEGRTGTPLFDEIVGSKDVPKALWKAPVACLIVSGGAAVVADADADAGEEESPRSGGSAAAIVAYANEAALETVGLGPDEFDRLLTGSDGKPPSGGTTGGAVVEVRLPNVMSGDDRYQSGYSKKLLRRRGGGGGRRRRRGRCYDRRRAEVVHRAQLPDRRKVRHGDYGGGVLVERVEGRRERTMRSGGRA